MAKEPPGWCEKEGHFLHLYGDHLIVGWKNIGGFFRLPGSEMRDRFGRELRSLGIVYDLHMKIIPCNPCGWESKLKLWAIERGGIL